MGLSLKTDKKTDKRANEHEILRLQSSEELRRRWNSAAFGEEQLFYISETIKVTY